MIAADKRKAIFLLHQEGMQVREIARRLKLSRNTVRTIIAQAGAMPPGVRADKQQVDGELLRRLYQECDGWVVRMHEKLVEEAPQDHVSHLDADAARSRHQSPTRGALRAGAGQTRRGNAA